MEITVEAAGMKAIITIVKASPVDDALYTNCKRKLIRKKYKVESKN